MYNMHVCVCVCVLVLSPSISLYIYIYIYMCVCMSPVRQGSPIRISNNINTYDSTSVSIKLQHILKVIRTGNRVKETVPRTSGDV